MSVLRKVSHSKDDVKLYLPAVKALRAISGRPGKSWRDRWVLSLVAHHAALLADQAVALSDTPIDIPDLAKTRQAAEKSVLDVEAEKEVEYDVMVKSHLRELEKAWMSRDITEMLNIVTTIELIQEDAIIQADVTEPAVKALGIFLNDRRQFMPRMMPDDQCALNFFQGYEHLCRRDSQKGLDFIERAVWSGHHNKWLSETTIPIVISQLSSHPSLENDLAMAGREITKSGPSHQICFSSLLHILGITQEDLNPSLKSCWPELSVPGINQSGTRKYEKTVFQQVQEGKLNYSEAGYALIDFIPSACHSSELAVCFLNASLWFLKDLRTQRAGNLQQVYALKMMTLSCVEQAYYTALRGLHPGMQLYVSRFGLAIAGEAIMAAGKCATSEDSKIVVELYHSVIKKGRFCPFWKMPIVPICEALLLNILTGRLHTEFMFHLQKDPNNGLLEGEEVKYQMYENDLKWLCPVENKDATRERAMEALMATKGLSWSDVSDSMCSVLSPRTPDGWLLQQEHLEGKLPFSTLTGFQFNTDSSDPFIKLTAVPARHPNRGLFSSADVQTVLQIPKEDLFPIIFSLDPPNESQRFHPFQQLRFHPSSLENTDLLHTLLQTDYLMKCFSVGSDVSAKPPFQQRSCSEGLTAKLPPHMKKVLAPVFTRGGCSNKTSRFWIQADEIDFNVTQNGSLIQCRIGAVKMVVRTSPQFPGLDGKLRDIEEDDPDSPESKFARDLTENYDEISKYFPMFGRLRELCKLQILGMILGSVMEDMQNKANGIGITIPARIVQEIQAEARRENESRIQQMLRDIRGNVGVWPAAQDPATVSRFTEMFREEIQSQCNTTWIPREVQREIERMVREKLREKDQNCIDQITRNLTDALRGRRYRGNIRQCVSSWLEYGSQDLKHLLLSAMPVPTENDLREAIIAERKKRLNAFKSVVDNISKSSGRVPRRTCTWVPAALNVEENGDTMRMCYGGVFLAPHLNETAAIPRVRGEMSYNLWGLDSTRYSPVLTHYGHYEAPDGLTTHKDASPTDSPLPHGFLQVSKPIEMKSDSLIVLEISVKQANTHVLSYLTNALAAVERGSRGKVGGGATTGSGRGGRAGASGGGSRGGGGGGGGDDGGDDDGRHKIWVAGALLAAAFLQGPYENTRRKYEKCERHFVPKATEEAQKRASEMLPDTSVLRSKRQQEKFRFEQLQKGKIIDGMHVAHRVGLDLMKHILIQVDGRELTKNNVKVVQDCCNRSENFDLVPAETNKSEHVIIDHALKKAITDCLEGRKVSAATWATLQQNWSRVREVVAELKGDYWPAVVSQRVQVLRRVINPNDSAQNLWDI